MSQNTDVHLRRLGDVVILDIIGDVTSFAEEKIDQAYKNASRVGTRKILINFKEDDYINSAGIAIIIGIVTEGRRKGETIGVVQPSKHFQKLFDMIGLTQYVNIFGTEREALLGF